MQLLLKLFNKNMHDKFAFFVEVMQHDTVAPQMGGTSPERVCENETE